MDEGITVILNGFQRGFNIKRQVKAIKQQTIAVKKIMLWYNKPNKLSSISISGVRSVDAFAFCSENLGVWARFYYALNAETKYICILDDDIIPGKKWLENCLETSKTHKGLLGGHGLMFTSKERYVDTENAKYNYIRYGWPIPNEEIKQVDIVGHAWFFEKSWLIDAFMREDKLINLQRAGEDMHFSYTLQKYLQINTYVPPHPKENKDMWSNIDGDKIATDNNAISTQHIKNNNRYTFLEDINSYFKQCIQNGWQLQLKDSLLDKNINHDFEIVKNLLKEGIPFAFNRFSDGELAILQNRELIIDSKKVKVEGVCEAKSIYNKEDFKHFDPHLHSFYREKLLEAFTEDSMNYFCGITCRCCSGGQDLDWQLRLLQGNKKSYTTWANLFLNSNYGRFINEIYPLFNQYKTVAIANEKAQLNCLPFVVKEFRVGYNAMINDYNKIEEISLWMEENNIEGYLFLMSASSFAKLAIHQLYKKFPKNTYIDIGTSINAFINMDVNRSYLKDYWLHNNIGESCKTCIW